MGRRFDLIIAPYRALQNLEDDSQLEGLFRSVREHLAPGGTCVLNVFHPSGDPETLKRDWRGGHEEFCWECPLGTDRLVHSIRKARIDPERLILYPQLIYRRYTGDSLQEETVLEIAMRCYYPEEFDRLIREHGFEITNRWGGYAGESYGVGPELVVQFTR
jgi:hypothetical protein